VAIGIASADGLIDIGKKLANYLHTLNATGQPVKYQLAPMPGMPPGDLLNPQLIGNLSRLKNSFWETKDRLANVTSLQASDPRRIAYRQPAADSDLSSLSNAFSQYSNTVAQVHDACRKAAQVSVCTDAVSKVSSPPPASKVELPPLPSFPPSIGGYFFAIDGVPVSPSENLVLAGPVGDTLLHRAQTLVNPSAVNVDLIARISTPWVSRVDIIIFKPNRPYLPMTLGGAILTPQDLTLPSYFPNNFLGNFAIHLACGF
jgi:hypothetical protein